MLPSQGLVETPSIESYFNRAANGGLTCWYTGATNQTAHGTAAPAVDTIAAYPVLLNGGVLDTIAFEVTAVGTAGSKARCGIYKNTSDLILYPSSLVIDGGEFICDAATGVKSTTGLSISITSGLYWFVYTCGTAAPTCRFIALGGTSHMLGLPAAMGTNLYNRIFTSTAYAALPANFPAGGNVSNNNTALIAVHYSA